MPIIYAESGNLFPQLAS